MLCSSNVLPTADPRTRADCAQLPLQRAGLSLSVVFRSYGHTEGTETPLPLGHFEERLHLLDLYGTPFSAHSRRAWR